MSEIVSDRGVAKKFNRGKGDQALFDDIRYFFYITNDVNHHGGNRQAGEQSLQSGESDFAIKNRRQCDEVAVDNLSVTGRIW